MSREIINFIDRAIALKFDAAQQFLRFIPPFMERYRKAASKLPYHVNVIDELGADENAHSRILARLLQQKTAYEKFEILKV